MATPTTQSLHCTPPTHAADREQVSCGATTHVFLLFLCVLSGCGVCYMSQSSSVGLMRFCCCCDVLKPQFSIVRTSFHLLVDMSTQVPGSRFLECIVDTRINSNQTTTCTLNWTHIIRCAHTLYMMGANICVMCRVLSHRVTFWIVKQTIYNCS